LHLLQSSHHLIQRSMWNQAETQPILSYGVDGDKNN
jgi:hypothetical protein